MLAGMEALVKPSELMGCLGPMPPGDEAALSRGREGWRAQIRVCWRRLLGELGQRGERETLVPAHVLPLDRLPESTPAAQGEQRQARLGGGSTPPQQMAGSRAPQEKDLGSWNHLGGGFKFWLCH